MNSDQVREKFLKFFAKKGHKIVESDSLVPSNDKSVLFTSAGMNQFKEQFMGNITDFKRAASSQKCMRTADLINVGKSPTHHTFFEMLGNFSFGDYFKDEAIQWAWEFITEDLKIPKDKLWVSVHHTDNEAYDIWLNKINIDKARIVKLGDADNFWPANAPKEGPNGPCGPCSEIFYDWGEDTGCKKPDCNPACDCKRFFEIWNLVFTQYDRQPDGQLKPLPSKNIDTGMGLERIVSVMQNVRSNYETDLFAPILKAITSLLERDDIAVDKNWLNTNAKAISDHIRAATFAIGDGIVPSNETRGYVIRKLIRRSIIYLKQVGVNKPVCFQLVFSIASAMKKAYPILLKRHENIAGIIKKEEEMFWNILNDKSEENKIKFKEFAEKKPKDTTTALIAFNQYDTYGVPLEISKENAQEFGLDIDDDEFEKLMDEQRKRSRESTNIANEIFAKSIGQLLTGIKSNFVGYEKLQINAKIIKIIKNNELVESATVNDEVEVVLDNTPFYAESGGQIGDIGVIYKDNAHLDVITTLRIDNAILHKAKIKNGCIKNSDEVTACVTTESRVSTARNHTATHLLQYALRKVLGDTVEQAGSYVAPEKLRFDFNYLKQLKSDTTKNIETIVNECILENINVKTEIMDIAQAKKSGALAFFADKYKDKVRVLSIGDKSKEFCGGTHVQATGQIGIFKIVSEYSVAQGTRRIEAVTGKEAFKIINQNESTLFELTELFKTTKENIIESARKAIKNIKAQNKELQKYKINNLSSDVDSLIKKAEEFQDITLICKDFKDYDMNMLLKISDLIKAKKEKAIYVLASENDNKGLLLIGISKILSNNGLDAVKIIKQLTSGSGGGKKDLAQAGSKDFAQIKKALSNVIGILKNEIKNMMNK